MANPSELAEQVRSVSWYHTFDLPGGVTTTGLFDHRNYVRKLPIPESLAGMRCLDACASDGFFGFEMARRGAEEVVSFDLPDHNAQDFSGPPRTRTWDVAIGRANQCFELVRSVTGLNVRRVDGSVYEIDKLDLGEFDYVFLGNILLHLRDPIGALHALRNVARGELLSVEPISLPQTVLRPFTPTGQYSDRQYSVHHSNIFWTPNLRAHRAIVRGGGFEIVAAGGPIIQRMGGLFPRLPDRAHLPKTVHEVVYWAFTRQVGQATAWVRARRATG